MVADHQSNGHLSAETAAMMAALQAEMGTDRRQRRKPASLPVRQKMLRLPKGEPLPDIQAEDRFTINQPCPICGGSSSVASGHGRCPGFYSHDRLYAFCTEEFYAGDLKPHDNTVPTTYKHRLTGRCKCGKQHDQEESSQRGDTTQEHQTRKKVRERSWRIVFPDGSLAGLHTRIDYSDGSKAYPWSEQKCSPKDMPLYGVVELLAAEKNARVYVTEGEKSADALRSQGLLAVGTVCGASSTPCDASLLPLLGYDVVLWPDHDLDEKGQRHMERIATRLYTLGKEQVRKLQWPSAPLKGDAADYVELGKPVDFLSELLSAYAPPTEAVDRFALLTLEDAAKIPLPRPLLGKVLSEGAISIFYGPSGVWKTFVVLSWALSIATGRDWLGLPVKQGTVIYVTGEGVGHISKRVEAWQRYHGVPHIPNFRLIRKMVRFLDDADVAKLTLSIQEQLADDIPTLIVVDTLALAMVGGSENDSEDTSALLTAAQAIRDVFGCCVLFVHHTGYDTSHMRGSTALFGNADTVIRAESTKRGSDLLPGMPMRIVSEKPRDDGPFPPITVTTELLTWPHPDEPARDLGSLVVVETDTPAAPMRPPDTSPPSVTYSKAARTAWSVLAKLCIDHPEGVRAKDWEAAALKSGTMVRSTFSTSKNQLNKDGWVTKYDDLYRVTTPGDAAPPTRPNYGVPSPQEADDE